MGYLRRTPEPKTCGVNTPQVSSVVQVPGGAKAESDEYRKIQALRGRLKQTFQIPSSVQSLWSRCWFVDRTVRRR